MPSTKPLLVALATAALVATGCNKQSGPAQQAPPPPTVTVAPVEPRELVETDEFTGRIEAVESVEIRPRVSGYLSEIKFKAGQKVKKGDLLFLIDPRQRQADVEKAKADLQRAKVRFEIAEREATRGEQLRESKTISTEEADQRKWGLMDARAGVASAEAALSNAALHLEFSEVRSPIDGRVSRALVTTGNNVSGVDGFTTLLTTVVSVDPVYVYTDVDEATLLRFQRLTRENKVTKNADGKVEVRMAIADGAGLAQVGYIESFDNRLQSETGSILLRTVFPNADEKLVPGLFARLSVPLSEKKPVTLVNERAIGTDQSQKFVLTLTSSNTVAYRPVKLGPVIDGLRVVREGLKAGEQVVVNGLQRVQPGATVTPEKEAKPATQASAN